MLDLQKLDRVLDIDCNKKTIRVEAGITLCHLAEHVLPKHGLALPVISITSAPSLAGAISTCTHGTGARFPMMAFYIIDIDIMTSSGELISCSSDEKPVLFNATCCGLGALGIIVSATIQCEAAFNLHETLTPMKFVQVMANLDDHVNSGDHVQFLWMAHTDDIVISRASRTERPVTTPPKSSWFWDTLIWEKAAESLQQLKDHMDAGRLYVHQPILIRITKSDDIMLSPSYRSTMCYINIGHTTPYGNRSPNLSTWGVFQDVMRAAGGIPHWGKCEEPFTSAEYEKLLPCWKEFCEIRKKMDPDGMFLNDFLEKCFTE